MKTQQAGFTLIELVIVIVILGILASFAVPRFADTAKDARAATVSGLGGSVRSAAALAKAAALARGTIASGSISVEGQTITLASFYPNASTIADAIADYSGFAFTVSGSTATFAKDGAASPAACKVTYTEAASGSAPTITILNTDCS